tara:strand:+ start:779 stop:1528 length:750 start_codon:yes stop_codon:yes gene_type:complete
LIKKLRNKRKGNVLVIMINHEEKFIFLHIPKTGGTSIEHILTRKESTEGSRHYSIKKLGLNKQECDKYKIFVVLRNPFTRIASTYNHFMHGPDNEIVLVKRGFLMFDEKTWNTENYTFNDYVLNIQKYFNGELQVGTNEGTRKLHRVYDNKGRCILDSHHIETLQWWTKTKDSDNADCEILRFEKLNQDWEKFKGKINFDDKLQKVKKDNWGLPDSEDSYLSYYDNESKKIIEKIYKKDLELFKELKNK